MYRRVSRLSAVVTVGCLSFWPAVGQAPPPRPQEARTAPQIAAMRDLWLPSRASYVRDWSVKAVGDRPLETAPRAVSGWPPVSSWGDLVDLGHLAGAPGSTEKPAYAVAATEIDRPSISESNVTLFVPGRARIWLNGSFVGSIEPQADAVFPVAATLAAKFRPGTNLLAVELENRGGPWLIRAAISDRGRPTPRPAQLLETLALEGDLLTLGTRAWLNGPVSLDIIGPGGRPMGTRETGGGSAATFDTSTWPDGPFEIRVRASDPMGRPLHSYHPWFKGSLEPVAARIRQKAAAESSDDSGRWSLLAALIESDEDPEAAHSVAMEAAELALGADAAARPYGFVRLAWLDDVDGSAQFCRAYLPPNYDANRLSPTILNLHGFNPPNPPYTGSWSVTERHHPAADRYGVIWIEPHGRGNAQYMGIGEKDVLRCLEEAKKRLAVDPARTYLTGESMGGSGTWLIGSRHSSLFAAIAPVFGGWDFRLHPHSPFSNPHADRPMERWLAEAHSSFAGAEQLLNTPVLVLHGDADQAVDVEFSRHAVTMLQRWGYDVRYREYPGRGHEDLGSLDFLVPWLLEHRLDPVPPRVRIRSVDLAGASSGWLDVIEAEGPLELIEADAEVLGPGQVRIDTRNVAALRLQLPPRLSSGDGMIVVTWNGIERSHSATPDGSVILSSTKVRHGLRKTSSLPGGLSNVFATPFIIVTGTSSRDPAMAEQVRLKAEELARRWEDWQHARPRIVEDAQITEAELSAFSLVLIGGPDANSVAKRFASEMPLKFGRDRISVQGRDFPADDAVAQMVRPNPLNRERYLMMVGATSAEGLWLWDSAQYWRPGTGQPTNFYDWTIVDGRVPSLEAGLSEERGWIASGVFDSNWRSNDQLIFSGDSAARAHAPVRRMDDRGIDLPTDQLKRLAGRYALPGTPVVMETREQGGRLELITPDGEILRLLARDAERFVTPDLKTVVTFTGVDPCDMVLESAGQKTRWTRQDLIDDRCSPSHD